MTRYRWLLMGLVVVILAGSLAYALHQAPDTGAGVIPESDRTAAPDFTGIDGWINTKPLHISQLRGQVVLVDFWTFSCVNCVRTIPHLQALQTAYGSRGLTIVGVHSPEFDFEKQRFNVQAAVTRLGISWPVALDSEMATWNAYANQYWPAEYLVDRQGRIAALSVGEGDYAAVNDDIAALLGVPVASLSVPTTPPPVSGITLELYAGSERGRLADSEQYGPADRPVTYPDAEPSQTDAILLSGTWRDEGSYMQSDTAGHVRLRFHAHDVYVVAGTPGAAVQATVTLDGGAPGGHAGPALQNGTVSVGRDDLFHLLTAEDTSTHLIDIAVPPGFQLYTFTFG